MLRVTYQLACAPGEDPAAKARDVALEQTAELPASALPAEAPVVGHVEALEAAGGGRWRAVIAYRPEIVGADLSQLLNVLFGNVSLKSGILVTGVEIPRELLARYGGPALGIDGVRALCGAQRRPILCTAIKPIGLPAAGLAELALRFARAGMDIIKDDHGLANQASAPFAERVARCQEAVAQANQATGGRSLYFPNVTAGPAELRVRVETARAAGCQGVMVSPMLTGLETIRELAATSGLAILAHPSMTGAFFRPDHGVRPDVLLGRLFRLAGADGVIYPNPGGRFPWDEATCRAVNDRLREPWDGVRRAFPVPGGGVDAARVPEWVERYGPDTIFLVGSSLYAQGDVERAAARLVGVVRRYGP
ncbi:MAG: RuBisCO large subunit C-terminal-like domain-containing protein [Gemmatimonadales bacterium]